MTKQSFALTILAALQVCLLEDFPGSNGVFVLATSLIFFLFSLNLHTDICVV